MPDSAELALQADIEAERRPEPRTVFLGGLLALAILAACYEAAEIVLPIVLAFVLSAVFQPVLRFLEGNLHLPRPVAALLIVLALVALFAGVGLFLAAPLSERIAQLPQTLPRIQQRLHFLSGPMRELQHAAKHLQSLAPGDQQHTVAIQSTPLAERVLSNVRIVAGGAFTTLLVLFFVLLAGDQFLRRLVDILPEFRQKRQAVEISREVEEDISAYLATVTMMNALVGVGTGVVAWGCGLGAPLLFGTIAFLLNYVPILGPTAGVLLFLVAGLVTIEPLWMAFLPAVLYLLIHLAEGETITPMILASRFTVNPVLITIGVVFWYWMWGVVGAILSTPMLAIVKIICDRVDTLKPVGHFIGGEPIILAGNRKAAQ